MLDLNLVSKENPPIQFVIQTVRNLPDGLLEAHGLLMPFDNSVTGFNEIRKMYRAKADWLAYYFGDASLIDELTYTDKALYKFHAEISKAWIEIIQEAFLLSPELQKEYVNPSLFWGLLESEFFQKLLSKSGLTDKASPTPKNKRYSKIIECCDELEDPNILLKTSEITTSPTQWFCSHALEICAISENYLFRGKWRQFLKTIKRSERSIKQSPLKTAYVEDDVIKFLLSGRE